MAFDKWILKVPDSNLSIVIKRNDKDSSVIIGGHKLFLTQIENIVSLYFGKPIPENSHSQRSRIRFIFNHITIDEWQIFIKALSDDFILERVQSHGRVI
jgi:hypothetical protein